MLKYTTFDIVFQELPDEVTLAINISGCPNRCAGCHTPELMEDRGEALTEGVLGDLLEHYGRSITAVCFMGGDNSPSEVFSLAGFVRRVSSLRVGWYSGRGTLPCDLSLF
ncbi:MAG: 4Fe-4S cluster-binding domain-containing protein, partial [Rikenellaceae bacterium]